MNKQTKQFHDKVIRAAQKLADKDPKARAHFLKLGYPIK